MENEPALRGSVSATASGSPQCLNCSARLVGPFCAECGQRDSPPYPSVRELGVDTISELSGWDGRIAFTLRKLVQRPGLLTREFLEGRRARYISPLRLYLMTSLVYFVLAASAPNIGGKSDGNLIISRTATEPDGPVSRPEQVAGAASAAMEKGELSTAERDAALKEIAGAPGFIRPFLRRAVTDPSGLKQGIFANMPRMLFALLPAFAGIVALFYRRRKYPEHLYFAIHLHAFIFLALAVTQALKFTRLLPLVTIASMISLVWIPVYATLAFRRLYSGSLGKTLAKELAIVAIYAVTAAAAFIIMIYWVSIVA